MVVLPVEIIYAALRSGSPTGVTQNHQTAVQPEINLSVAHDIHRNKQLRTNARNRGCVHLPSLCIHDGHHEAVRPTSPANDEVVAGKVWTSLFLCVFPTATPNTSPH